MPSGHGRYSSPTGPVVSESSAAESEPLSVPVLLPEAEAVAVLVSEAEAEALALPSALESESPSPPHPNVDRPSGRASAVPHTKTARSVLVQTRATRTPLEADEPRLFGVRPGCIRGP